MGHDADRKHSAPV